MRHSSIVRLLLFITTQFLFCHFLKSGVYILLLNLDKNLLFIIRITITARATTADLDLAGITRLLTSFP